LALEVKKKGGLPHGFQDRSERLKQIEVRMRQVQGELIGAGHMPEDAIGWRRLRELEPEELIPDGVARLRRVWGWLWDAFKGVDRCCSGSHGDVEVKQTPKGHHLGNLIHCDRSICHIDAAAKAADRRQKLLAVVSQIPEDAILVLKVYTNRHRKGALLVDIEKQQRVALKGMFDCSFARKATYGRAVVLEITHSDKNGHHPHRNCLEAYRPGTNLEEQREWEQTHYRDRVKAAGGSADLTLQAGWWEVVEREKLIQVINYISKDEDLTWDGVEGDELVDVLTETVSYELTHGHNKKGKATLPITDLRVSVDAYVEAWAAKHLTWWSVSGCFKPVKVEDEAEGAAVEGEVADPETENEDHKDEELKREKEGATVAWIDPSQWARMGPAGRNAVAAMVYGGFNPGRFLALLGDLGVMWGFGLGKRPKPPDSEDSP
jgi:hypothetical protein